MSADRPVLVTGATGPHGHAIVAALRSAGRAVRALTRDPRTDRARRLAELGAEPVVGDLADPESLVAAMAGASAAYAVTTPFAAGADDEVAQGEGIITAAEIAELPWLILASVASAGRGSGIPHFESKWRIEQRLRGSQIPHTVVAPTYFFENLDDPAAIIATGELTLPLPADRPLQQVALEDLGTLVAALLERRDELLGARLEVAGDQPTPAEMADALAAAGGGPVAYRRLDLERTAARSADIAAMYGFLATTGYDVDLPALRRRFPELRWTSFAAWAQQRVTAAA